MLQNIPLKPRNYNYSDHNHKPLTNYFDIVDSASLYARVKSFPELIICMAQGGGVITKKIHKFAQSLGIYDYENGYTLILFQFTEAKKTSDKESAYCCPKIQFKILDFPFINNALSTEL